MASSVWPGFSCASSARRQPAQLVVDQRQQLLGGVGVALLDRAQNAGDLVHEVKDSRRQWAANMDRTCAEGSHHEGGS